MKRSMSSTLCDIYKVWRCSFKWPLCKRGDSIVPFNSFGFRVDFLYSCYRDRHNLISIIDDHEFHYRLIHIAEYVLAGEVWPVK